LARLIAEGQAGPCVVVAVLVRDPGRHVNAALLPSSLVDSLGDVLDARPDVVVEAAGHDAVRAHVAEVLHRGVDVLCISIGALADPDLLREVTAAARAGRSRLLLASGAVGSLDALRAARALGLDTVTHTIRKPLAALPEAPASQSDKEVVVFTGTARAAALKFPANANVVAAVGLAGLGLDETRVEIIGSPTAVRNTHQIHAAGAFGELTFQISNRPDPANPRSSVLAAGSLAAALAGLTAPVSWAS
jgi:aspartate dehydrogenase